MDRSSDQPLIILPADNPPEKLKWVIREYIGSEIHKSLEPGPDGYPVPLTRFEDLQEGDEVYAWDGSMQFTVRKDESGRLYGAVGGRLQVFLEFAQDDRKCWVAAAVVNLKGLRRLELRRSQKDQS